MPTNYPSDLDDNSTLPNKSPGDVVTSAENNTQIGAVKALEEKVGEDGSADTDSHDYKIANHSHTGADGSDTTAHEADATAAHAASAVAFTPTGTIAATNVQTAIAELGTEDAAVHIADTSAAHAASAVAFTPQGSIAATTVQAAIQEVRDEAAAGLSVFNVKASPYLAAGDANVAGTTGTNDTAAIQAAIDAAVAAGGGIVFFPPGRYRCTGGLSVVGDGIVLQGSGRPGADMSTGTLLTGNSASGTTDLLTLSSSGFHMEGFTLRDIGLQGSASGRYAMRVATAATYAAGLTLSTFENFSCLTSATAYEAFYVPDQADFNDNRFTKFYFGNALSGTSTARAVVRWEGHDSINANTMADGRIHCNASTVCKGFIMENPVAFPNNWNAANTFRDIVFEQARAGMMEINCGASTIIDHVQNWDSGGTNSGPGILLTNHGGSTRTENTVISNYWSSRSLTDRNGHADIKLDAAKVWDTTITNPLEMSGSHSPSTQTSLIHIDAGSNDGLILQGIPNNAVLDNLPTKYVNIAFDGTSTPSKGVTLHDYGTDIPSGGEPGDLLGVGEGPASAQRLYFNDQAGTLSYVSATPWVFTNDAVPGLVAWFKADSMVADGNAAVDGDAVATWTDKSVTGVNAVQATGANKLLYKTSRVNGKPAVLFDGTNDFMALANPLGVAANRNLTLFIVANRTGATNYKTLVDLGGSGVNGFLIDSGQPTDDKITMFYGDGSAIKLVYAVAPGTGYKVICCHVANGAVARLLLNGTRSDPGTVGNAAVTSITNMTIGNEAGQTRYFDADIAEILLYNTALSQTQRATVNNYLGTKYALSPIGSD